MSPPERPATRSAGTAQEPGGARPPSQPLPRYGRYAALLAIVILGLITVNTVLTKPNGVTGLSPGARLPPFAVPLVLGQQQGAADVALLAGQGARVPACKLRGPGVMNICQLYEAGPVVIALFVDGASCAEVLGRMQALVSSFPGVQFAAVALKPTRGALRKLIVREGISFPVGLDVEDTLVPLFKLATCPQLTFAYPGGVVASRALLNDPSIGTLRSRVAALVAGSRERGWRPPA